MVKLNKLLQKNKIDRKMINIENNKGDRDEIEILGFWLQELK